MDNQLTTTETAELAQHEATIQRGLREFVEVGNALAAIRKGNLYRQEFNTFEEYCKEKWDISPRRAYQLTDAAQILDELRTNGTQTEPPKNERAARELKAAPAGKRAEAWQKATTEAPPGKQPTAAQVKTAVTTITLESIPTKYHKILSPLNDEQTAAVWQWAMKLWPDGRIPGERLAQRVAQVAVRVEAVAPPPPAVHVAGTPRTSVAPVPPVAGPTAAMPALCPTHARPYGVMLHGGDGRYILQCPACPADTAIVVCEC
jgi:hypothetical protein